MKKYLFLLLTSILSCTTKEVTNEQSELNNTQQTETPLTQGKNSQHPTFYWDSVNIAKVKALLYFPEVTSPSGDMPIMNEYQEVNSGVIPAYTRYLNKSQIKTLANKLKTIDRTDSIIEISLCFNPHHALVFYDHQERILGHMSICFVCNRYKLEPSHPNHNPISILALQALIKTLDIPLFDSDETRKAFMKKEGVWHKVKQYPKPPLPISK